MGIVHFFLDLIHFATVFHIEPVSEGGFRMVQCEGVLKALPDTATTGLIKPTLVARSAFGLELQ